MPESKCPSHGDRASESTSVESTVTELNASTGSFVQTIGVGSYPEAVSSDGTHVWVANVGDH